MPWRAHQRGRGQRGRCRAGGPLAPADDAGHHRRLRSAAPRAGAPGQGESGPAPGPRPPARAPAAAGQDPGLHRELLGARRLEARPLNMFLKSPDAVIGPGDTIMLPEFAEPWIFMHEAELALVIKGPAKKVAPKDWQGAVFGYTGLIDVSAR